MSFSNNADLSRLIDRSSVGAKKAEGSAEDSDASSKLQTGTTQTAADVQPALPLPSRGAIGPEHEKRGSAMRSISCNSS